MNASLTLALYEGKKGSIEDVGFTNETKGVG